MDNYRDSKYKYRQDKQPYRYELALYRHGGEAVKMYEFFDGEKVTWSVSQDFTSEVVDKYCNSTPMFENVVDENGKDRERIIYKSKDQFGMTLLGRINGSDVLYNLSTTNLQISPNFNKMEDFGGKKVKIDILADNKVKVNYHDYIYTDKVILFDCEKFKPFTNEFDGIYDNKYFIKTYAKENFYVEVFVGELDYDTGEVKPVGYNLSKGEFIEFPITDGLINDDEMKKMVLEDKYVEVSTRTRFGMCYMYDEQYARDVDRSSLESTLRDILDVYTYEEELMIIKDGLEKYNKERVMKKER